MESGGWGTQWRELEAKTSGAARGAGFGFCRARGWGAGSFRLLPRLWLVLRPRCSSIRCSASRSLASPGTGLAEFLSVLCVMKGSAAWWLRKRLSLELTARSFNYNSSSFSCDLGADYSAVLFRDRLSPNSPKTSVCVSSPLHPFLFTILIHCECGRSSQYPLQSLLTGYQCHSKEEHTSYGETGVPFLLSDALSLLLPIWSLS